MTPEEQILKETEQIVDGYADEMSKRQTLEHQRMMPYLRQYADEMIANEGEDSHGIHLFVISQTEKDDEAHNPLNLNDGSTGRMSPMYTFDDIDDAVENLKSMPSAILFNEFRKGLDDKVAVYVRAGKFNALYTQNKLTIDRQLPNGDSMVNTASITDDEPEQFFSATDIGTKHKMLSLALLTFCELGRVAERQTPETYKLMAKRIADRMEGDDE